MGLYRTVSSHIVPLKTPFKAIICLECLRIARMFASFRKLESMNAMVTSDFRSDVEIWPFCACAVQKYVL